MTRGHMKMQAKQKNLKAKEAAKKSEGFDHKTAQAKSLVHKCPICMIQSVNLLSMKQHYESKHPKVPLPAELQGLQ
ncbi:hypothetical protein L596_010753 [Steinernema carpocapsae]|uniref:Small EDRK-rich factor-like N-terminal domain-containing protein n=1 Tax=Steinernema carpocapsae TaxID=34508 RepID=A0A4U5PK14_STECR|nr:hypothetical protein L596_010753 [Steinernema carpocapsae]